MKAEHETPIDLTARRIHECWRAGTVIDALDEAIRPRTVQAGYLAQQALAGLRGERVAGWKIAATAAAGQRHINVAHPLAGRLFASIVAADGAALSLDANRMRVAEAEFVLMIGKDLAPRDSPYTAAELSRAVVSVHPGLELPDSRFADFTRVGAASLIADDACASRFVLGAARKGPPDRADLAGYPTRLLVNGRPVTYGVGREALGGPLLALAWLLQTFGSMGLTLHEGQFVTTGVTGVPSPIAPGDRVTVDLGELGSVSAALDGQADRGSTTGQAGRGVGPAPTTT